MAQTLLRIVWITCFALLAACGVKHRSKNIGQGMTAGMTVGAMAGPVGAAAGMAAGGVIGKGREVAFDNVHDLAAHLQSLGVNIFINGQQTDILIPTDSIFVSCTPRMREDSVNLIAAITDYLHYFDKISLDVHVYTDNQTEADRALALTRQQARVFMHYLWDHNVDARVVSAMGYGQAFPIANNGVSEGQKLNRRIEISFSRLGK